MNKIIILGHENPDVDSVVSGYLLEKILNRKNCNSEFVIPDSKIEEDTLDICLRNGLDPKKFQRAIDSDKNNQFILVDHNERKVPGKIICIIDHHPTSKPIETENYYNKKISSTACFICQNNENLLDSDDIKLAVIATMVDTASFHSTKSRSEDREWVLKMCKEYNLDYEKLYKEGLCLTSMQDLKKASLNGLKKYAYGDKKVESSYIQIEEPSEQEDSINQITDKLREYLEVKKLDAFVFIVHDMTKFATMYYLITNDGITTKKYDVYTSRGNTIMPEVETKLTSNSKISQLK